MVIETEKISIILLYINGLNKKMRSIFDDLVKFLRKMKDKFYLANLGKYKMKGLFIKKLSVETPKFALIFIVKNLYKRK